MLRSLRVRFALSHTLPVLLLMPLVSLVLIYLLQTHYFLSYLAEGLVAQATIIARAAGSDADLWQERRAASRFVTALAGELPAGVMLIDRSRRLLAANPPAQILPGTVVTATVVDAAMAGRTGWQTRYSPAVDAEVVDVAVPIFDRQGQVLGAVRMYKGMETIQGRLNLLTWYILGVFGLGLVAALALALFLARVVGIPLVRLNDAVSQFPTAREPVTAPEQGPTEVRQLAAVFNHTARQLHAARRSRRRLLAGVVHEMSRPLAGIQGAAQYLTRYGRQEPALVEELAGGIVEQVEQMQRQLDDLLHVADNAGDPPPGSVEPVDLCAVCQEQARHLKPLLARKHLQLVEHFAPGTPPVAANRARVAQIVANLLNNAARFTPEGGQITVTVRPERASAQAGQRGYIVVQVADTGPGIPPAQQVRLFVAPGETLHRRPDGAGMGLGLAVAHRLAAAHGGLLTVASEPGRGAVFSLRLPASPPS